MNGVQVSLMFCSAHGRIDLVLEHECEVLPNQLGLSFIKRCGVAQFKKSLQEVHKVSRSHDLEPQEFEFGIGQLETRLHVERAVFGDFLERLQIPNDPFHLLYRCLFVLNQSPLGEEILYNTSSNEALLL